MNRDDIIRMAREAGLPRLEETDEIFCLTSAICFAALVAAAVENKWKQAVIDELVSCHIYSSRHEDDPRKALHAAICWNVEVALDPAVSSAAEELIQRGAAAEREACAQIVEMPWQGHFREVAAQIRARGQK